MQGQERKQAGAPFQFDQVDKIFRVLGHPNPTAWPLVEAMPHWAKNTGTVHLTVTSPAQSSKSFAALVLNSFLA
jgi:hypothetical protein